MALDTKSASGVWKVDRTSEGVLSIEEFHARVHAGTAYSISLVDETLGGGLNLDMLVRVVSGAHMQFGGACIGSLVSRPDLNVFQADFLKAVDEAGQRLEFSKTIALNPQSEICSHFATSLMKVVSDVATR